MNKSMTLDDLLSTLEKQAADQGEEKKEDDSKKDSGKEDASGGNPFAKKDEKKDEGKDEKSDKEDRVKEAQLQGSALAQEIMQKVASANITNKETEMNKSAAAAGKALANSLLEKLAGVGDVNTVDGIDPGSVPNKAQRDNAAMLAEREAGIQTTPTTDAKGDNGGSVNQIFDAIVADALGAGAATPHELGHVPVSAAEGAIEARQAPAGTESEEVEKAAAVSALVSSGFDFESAVEMVKAAEEEILAEEQFQVKQAAHDALVDAGIDPALAEALVKSAGALVPSGGRGLVGPAAKAKNFLQRHGGKLAAGAGVAAAAGGAGYALAREKQAAVNGLVDAGVDFDLAVGLVNEKASELYGI